MKLSNKQLRQDINAQTGTSYTLVDSDHGKLVTLDNVAAIALTVNTGLRADFKVEILQKGNGQVTLSGTATFLELNNRTKTLGKGAGIYIRHLGGNQHWLEGDLGPIAARPVPAMVQIHETSDTGSLPATLQPLTFNTTDVETATGIIEHNNVTTSRIEFKIAGWFKIEFRGNGRALSTGNDVFIDYQIIKNGTTVLPGTDLEARVFMEGVHHAQNKLYTSAFFNSAVDDYIEIEAMDSSGSAAIKENHSVLVTQII